MSHNSENKKCLFNFYSHAHTGVSECKMCPCTCEKQQQAPQEPAPTSVTGDEWKEEVAKYYAWMTSANNFSPDIRIKAWQDFIGHLLSAQRTHIKQDLREEILRKIVPSNYEHLPEHARAGAVLQDILHIINSLNEELA